MDIANVPCLIDNSTIPGVSTESDCSIVINAIDSERAVVLVLVTVFAVGLLLNHNRITNCIVVRFSARVLAFVVLCE